MFLSNYTIALAQDQDLDKDCKETVCSSENGYEDAYYDPNIDKDCEKEDYARVGDVCCCKSKPKE